MADTDVKALLPCPFCGSEPRMGQENGPRSYSYVHCPRCDYDLDAPTMEAAWKRWNTRAPDPEVQRLRGAIVERRNVYVQKKNQCDALATDTWNRWDAMQFVVEAFDILGSIAGIEAVLDEDGEIARAALSHNRDVPE